LFIGTLGEFHYGCTWWREHGDDWKTVALFHFGKPQPLPWDHLIEAGVQQRKERKEEKESGLDDTRNRDAKTLDHIAALGHSAKTGNHHGDETTTGTAWRSPFPAVPGAP